MVLDLSLGKRCRRMIRRLGCLLCLFSLASCFDQEVRLTREQINEVDSLFLAERKVWLTKLEDSCQLLRAQQLEYWIDSLQTKRQREIEKCLGGEKSPVSVAVTIDLLWATRSFRDASRLDGKTLGGKA